MRWLMIDEAVHGETDATAKLTKACEHRPQCPLEQTIRLTVDEAVHREADATAKLVWPAMLSSPRYLKMAMVSPSPSDCQPVLQRLLGVVGAPIHRAITTWHS